MLINRKALFFLVFFMTQSQIWEHLRFGAPCILHPYSFHSVWAVEHQWPNMFISHRLAFIPFALTSFQANSDHQFITQVPPRAFYPFPNPSWGHRLSVRKSPSNSPFNSTSSSPSINPLRLMRYITRGVWPHPLKTKTKIVWLSEIDKKERGDQVKENTLIWHFINDKKKKRTVSDQWRSLRQKKCDKPGVQRKKMYHS